MYLIHRIKLPAMLQTIKAAFQKKIFARDVLPLKCDKPDPRISEFDFSAIANDYHQFCL